MSKGRWILLWVSNAKCLAKASHLRSLDSRLKRDPSRRCHPHLPDWWAELPASGAHLHSAADGSSKGCLPHLQLVKARRDEVRSPLCRVTLLQDHTLSSDLSKASAHLLAGMVQTHRCSRFSLDILSGSRIKQLK